MIELNSKWEAKFDELSQQSASIEAEIDTKHKKEMIEALGAFEKKMSKLFKPTPDYLKLKEAEITLGRQKKYEEAEGVQKERIKLEKDLKETWERKIQEKRKPQGSIINQTKS